MLGNFDSFLSENRRQTQGGKIYPKFGQVIVELGTASTEFSKGKGVETTIGMMEKANELKSIMNTKLAEDKNVDEKNFDINLSENVSTVNLLMENEFLALPAHELQQVKSMIMCTEARLPSIVIKGGSLDQVVAEATKLGYKKSDIHVVFPMREMKINLADSDKLVIESLSIDDNSASEILSMAENIELGDVYVTVESVDSKAELSEITELKIKSGKNALTLAALNRKIMDQFIVKEAKEVSYARERKEDTGLPMLEGFKAYDLKQNITMIEHAQNAFTKEITVAPLSSTAWQNLVDVKEAYFDNGWKLKHNNTSIVLTNAEHAMRAGRVCEEYRVELSEAGYPLLDMIAMMESKGMTRFDCKSFAESMMKFDGCVTPERQTVTAFVTESASNRVFHPNIMSSLRPVTEMVDDVDGLIRALANDQFSTFKIGQSFSESMLDQETLYSMMESIVSDGVDVSVDGTLIEFKVNATNYLINIDIK
ncbi:hypothetical protein COHAPHLL_00107 [Vibrio phage V09]|uniref:Uncharacterized protein n=1 Tax=Vibrio phage V09 TaxID=2724327 RepID=A0A6H0X9J6_9CAUD|nr:hypothetical protein COHAPHLL_00107 [Vibrio phage V09]